MLNVYARDPHRRMIDYGKGPAGYPYHRFGSGAERLVILPGITDALGWNEPSRLTAELLGRYYFRAFREYDVWVLSRPPGETAGTAAEIAAGYADVLDTLGNSHVLGISLGGLVASHLAAAYPELVERAVFAVCGSRLGAAGTETVRRWKAYATNEQWRQLHRDYARTVYDGPQKRLVDRGYQLAGRWLPRPQQPADVVCACEATLGYDGTTVLEQISTPALVIGGDQDELFPQERQHEMARRLASGHLATISGGHAVYEQERHAFSTAVLQFLRGDV